MKKLLSCIAALFTIFSIVSCLQEERSPEEILVPSPAEVDCSESFSITSKVPKGSEKLVEECGFLVGTTKDLADALTVEGAMTENTFSAALPARKYGTTYYICSYVTNGRGSEIRSEVSSFALQPLDKYVAFEGVTMLSYDPSSKRTELKLETDIWSGVNVSEAGLCYGESQTLSVENDHSAGSFADDGSICVTINGFADGEQYYLRPYVKDGEYLAYGDAVEFVIPTIPEVLTYDAAEVTFEGAVLSGKVVKGADISERGFMLVEGTGTASDMTDEKVVEGTIGEYSLELSGLLPNQKYSYCAYVVNPSGTYYGDVKSFTTAVTKPSVSSPVASSITSTSATLSAAVRSHGGETVSEVGFYYSTDPSVDTEISSKVSSLYSQDTFSIEIADLTVNTKYYVKSYAKNSEGIACSTVESFTTSVSSPSVKTVGSSDVTSTSVTLSGIVVSDNGAEITERGFVWLQGGGTPTTESYRLKVDGKTGEFSGMLDELDPGEKYSFRAYAINSKGTSYGEIMNFSTVAGRPVLSAVEVSNIKEISATFSSTVTDHGGATVLEVGFYYSKTESFDVSSAEKVSKVYSTDGFTLSAGNLEVGTVYYVRAFAKNSAGEGLSDIVSFKTISSAPSVITLGSSKLTATSAELSGEVTDDNGETITVRGFVWMKGTGTPTTSGNKLQVIGTTGEFSATLEDLEPNQTYSFRAYAINSEGTSYGATMRFNIKVDLPTVTTAEVTNISDDSAVCGGTITSDGGGEILSKGVVWSLNQNPTIDLTTKTDEGGGVGSFTSSLTGLLSGMTYYIRAYVTNAVGTAYGDQQEFNTIGEKVEDLEAANCFIVSESDFYSFKTVKGNSLESVGNVASAEVLWESLGTSEVPAVGSLVSSVFVQDESILFEVADPFREGNAVIAAKDALGTILWSWHIWLTDQPEEQVYYNNAGTMMDRNLGATSATPGDVGTLGLLYQWGRKDPFLSGSSIDSFSIVAQSTITWSSGVSSSSTGTIEYAVEHPTTFITYNDSNSDWYYTGSSSTDDTRWQSNKTIYDPCPAGWRVPDGGDNGVWSKAKESSSIYNNSYDETNEGRNFSGDLGSDATIWYPTSGYRDPYKWTLWEVGGSGLYWSVTIDGNKAYRLALSHLSDVELAGSRGRAYGFSVRCMKEGSGGSLPEGGEEPNSGEDEISTSEAVSLSDDGSANSYIVSESGTYSIPAVKGNSSESVGSVSEVEVLWESFGTDIAPSKGDLVKAALYENVKIYFKTSDTFKEGNAVIAAKDAYGTILWSWHIWLTDEPEGQVYYNNAGTMMDRNLGATSATPGDVGALGLLYQWGRKDPFLSGCSIDSNDQVAKSTLAWPSAVSSDSSNGTIDYAVEHPTTFISYNGINYDWYYTGSSSTDNTRWQSSKTIYDPCPAGWRVPDGGSNGVWNVAGFSSTRYDDANKGISFSISSPSTTWYPASGFRYNDDGTLYDVGYYGNFWSVTPYSHYSYYLAFYNNGYVYPTDSYDRAYGYSVRCLQESE